MVAQGGGIVGWGGGDGGAGWRDGGAGWAGMVVKMVGAGTPHKPKGLMHVSCPWLAAGDWVGRRASEQQAARVERYGRRKHDEPVITSLSGLRLLQAKVQHCGCYVIAM